MLPSAIGREFIARTRYRVVANPNEADAILTGAVTNVMSAPRFSIRKRAARPGFR